LKDQRPASLRRAPQSVEHVCTAICHQVTTLDKAKLVQRLGMLDSESLARLNDGLKAALELF
jgi:mRNA-degrading endonuclease toxin of MazEF toxin-antitoxin module